MQTASHHFSPSPSRAAPATLPDFSDDSDMVDLLSGDPSLVGEMLDDIERAEPASDGLDIGTEIFLHLTGHSRQR